MRIAEDEYQFWECMRTALLMQVDAIERRMGLGSGQYALKPRTAHLRFLVREQVRKGNLLPADLDEASRDG